MHRRLLSVQLDELVRGARTKALLLGEMVVLVQTTLAGFRVLYHADECDTREAPRALNNADPLLPVTWCALRDGHHSCATHVQSLLGLLNA